MKRKLTPQSPRYKLLPRVDNSYSMAMNNFDIVISGCQQGKDRYQSLISKPRLLPNDLHFLTILTSWAVLRYAHFRQPPAIATSYRPFLGTKSYLHNHQKAFRNVIVDLSAFLLEIRRQKFKRTSMKPCCGLVLIR